MKKPLRRLTRILLKYLSIWVLKKHQGDIIAITGNGQTAIAREAIYTVLHEHFPTRRNLESPDAEFSVPLSIFGARSYPRSYQNWIKILTKTFLQIFVLKRHTHKLVLELNASNPEILKYWFGITNPLLVVICGDLPHKKIINKNSITFTVPKTTGGYLTPYFEVAKKIGHYYKIKTADIDSALAKYTLPKAKISILSGKKGKIIVDSTYYYFPPPLKSVLEILELIPGKKVFYTQDSKELLKLKKLETDIFTTNSSKLSLLKSFDVIVVRGIKGRTLSLIEALTS